MKVFVTGIAGAIGSHVGEALYSDGHEVFGIDNFDPYYDPAIKTLNATHVAERGVRVLRGDLATDSLSELITPDTEFILHFAGQPGLSVGTSFEHYVRNNIVATERLLARARTLPRLRAFVYVSTSSVYGKNAKGGEDELPRPTSGYGVTKLASEQLALAEFRTRGLPVIALRLFSVYGPRERPEKLFHRLMHVVAREEAFPLFEGSLRHQRSFTHVDDVVRAMLLVVSHYERAIGEIVNIGNNEVRNVEDGVRIIESMMGTKARFVLQPRRLGDQSETQAVITKAKKLFEFAPTISLEEGLHSQYVWYRDVLAPHLRTIK